ncbi:MAG TPA: threonine--tRNA ligase [Thermoanaerobaculia bacterium]|nr:threonine--tRNA ligase [Thermoanaerobaculia bacterium]
MEIQVTLPDGAVKSVPAGTTVGEIARAIGPGLAKSALAGRVDGKVVDLSHPVARDAKVEIVTPKSPDAVDVYRHSTAHLTANAVKRLFPDVKIGIGPAIENGYYYDFDPGRPFTPEDLAAIEAEMRKIVAEDNRVERLEMSKEEAIRIFEGQGDTLKVEIIRGIPDDRVSCYRQKDFIDLCRGPHVPSTGKLGVFKLTHTAGAYWKGDEHNPMLQRIYGASFLTQAELDAHLKQVEEAKARDHRKLGRELDLFSFHPWAPASPFFHPKGATIYNLLLAYVRGLYRKYGYREVITPQIFDVELFKTSGHYANYKENMYLTEIDEREFGVKPMNCPGHFLMYASQAFSYRDLPVRYADFGRLHRYERSGVTQGLTRVRTFSQDDSHIFCTLDQMPAEMDRFIDFIDEVYSTFGFTDVRVGLGTRPEKFIGTPENWEQAERALASAFEKRGREFFVNAGDGAFYGPKLDFQVKDAIGRYWQLGTLQVDFANPVNFDLTYIGEDGGKHRPVVLHRAILGSVERFLGILIEHTAGDFPVWLAPVQAVVIPVSDKFADYARSVAAKLSEAGFRVEPDARSEKLGARIRHAELQKIPYMLIVGEREQATGSVSPRKRKAGDLGSCSLDEFSAALAAEAARRE